MLIVLSVLLVVIGCFVAGIREVIKKINNEGECFCTGGFVLFILLLIWSVSYATSAYRIEQLKTFQNIDYVNMEKVMERTLSQVDLENKSEWGLEKMEVYKAISERMEEWVSKIEEYNKKLTGYRWYKSNIFLNWFVSSTDDLDYIELK